MTADTDTDPEMVPMMGVPMMIQMNEGLIETKSLSSSSSTNPYQRKLSLILILSLITVVLLLALFGVMLNANLAPNRDTVALHTLFAPDSTSISITTPPPAPSVDVTPPSLTTDMVPAEPEPAVTSSPTLAHTPVLVPVTLISTLPTPLYDVSLMLMFVDEVRFLRVFIEYYLLIGVQHFYLYDNHEGGSQDGTWDILQSYIGRGLVTYQISWVKDEGLVHAQRRTYASFWNDHRHETKWLVNVDADEYVVLKQHKTLSEFLAPFDPYGGVAITWRWFSTSGVEEIGPRQIMMEELTWASELWGRMKGGLNDGWGKMIIQPTRTSLIDVHFSVFIEPYDPVWADQKVIPFPRGFSDPNTINQGLFLPLMTHVATDLIQLNHYFFRDEKYLREVKFDRRFKNEGDTRENNINRNLTASKHQDLTIQPFMPLLRERMEPWWSKEN